MEREHRYLDRKGQENQQEGEQLKAHCHSYQRNLDCTVEEVRREVNHTRGRLTMIANIGEVEQ